MTSIYISAFILTFGFTKYNEPSQDFPKDAQIMSIVNVINIEMYKLLWQTLYLPPLKISECAMLTKILTDKGHQLPEYSKLQLIFLFISMMFLSVCVFVCFFVMYHFDRE